MPSVTVRLFATVREAAGASRLTLDVKNLGELLAALRRDYGHAMTELVESYLSDSERLVILVNGMNPGPKPRDDLPLHSGDDVAIFPPVSGG